MQIDGVKISKDCMKPIKECAKVNKDSSKLSDVFVVIKETKKDKVLPRQQELYHADLRRAVPNLAMKETNFANSFWKLVKGHSEVSKR